MIRRSLRSWMAAESYFSIDLRMFAVSSPRRGGPLAYSIFVPENFIGLATRGAVVPEE